MPLPIRFVSDFIGKTGIPSLKKGPEHTVERVWVCSTPQILMLSNNDGVAVQKVDFLHVL